MKSEGFVQLFKMGVFGAAVITAVGCTKTQDHAPSSFHGGFSTAGIIGGTDVQAGDPVLNSTVGIVNLAYGQVVCTGTLITENMVLTAAHCTTENPTHLAIMFSSKLPQSSDEAAGMQFRQVAVGKTGAAWPSLQEGVEKNWGDIAVLRFLGGAPDGYKPATLLGDASLLRAGQTAVLAGFGLIDASNKIRTKALRKTEISIADPKYSETEVLFDQRQGTGACKGDSGGPAFLKVGNELYLFGVTSRGVNDPDVTCAQFVVFTNASAQIEWLKQTIDDLNKAEKIEPIPQPDSLKFPADPGPGDAKPEAQPAA